MRSGTSLFTSSLTWITDRVDDFTVEGMVYRLKVIGLPKIGDISIFVGMCIRIIAFMKKQLTMSTENPDWWDELTDKEQSLIQQGLQQLEKGERLSNNQVQEEIGKLLGKQQGSQPLSMDELSLILEDSQNQVETGIFLEGEDAKAFLMDWKKLPDAVKSSIKTSRWQLENGEGIPLKDVLAKYRKRYQT
jgi:hypothetical protein